MQASIPVIGLILFAIVVNIPCGYLRENYRRLSFMWFLMIHIPIPFIVLLRVSGGFSWHILPLTLAGAIVGQLVGGHFNRRRKRDGETG